MDFRYSLLNIPKIFKLNQQRVELKDTSHSLPAEVSVEVED
jgi:hypothetical protein